MQGEGQADGMASLMEDMAENDEAEPMEEDTPSVPAYKPKVSAELKERVQEVLRQKDFASMRAAKLSQDDFLLLLSLFNQAGFHFA